VTPTSLRAVSYPCRALFVDGAGPRHASGVPLAKVLTPAPSATASAPPAPRAASPEPIATAATPESATDSAETAAPGLAPTQAAAADADLAAPDDLPPPPVATALTASDDTAAPAAAAEDDTAMAVDAVLPPATDAAADTPAAAPAEAAASATEQQQQPRGRAAPLLAALANVDLTVKPVLGLAADLDFIEPEPAPGLRVVKQEHGAAPLPLPFLVRFPRGVPSRSAASPQAINAACAAPWLSRRTARFRNRRHASPRRGSSLSTSKSGARRSKSG